MAADALSTELIHQILHYFGVSLHAEDKTALLQCGFVSHLFLILSREVLLSNLTIDLDCNSPNSVTRIPAFFDLLLHPDCSFTRPLSLNIVCQSMAGEALRPHWEQARFSLLEGFERYKRFVKIGSMKVEIGDDFWVDRCRLIQALGAMAQPCIRRLYVEDTWEDAELREWIDIVSHGKCPNLQDIQLRFYGWIPVFDVRGASSSMLTVLNLAGGMSRLWIGFINWVERGGAVLESLSLNWTVDDENEDDLPSRLRNVFSHRVTSQLRKIYFDGPSVTVDLAHLPLLRFISISVDQYQGLEHLGIAPATSHMLSSLLQHRTPITIEIYITTPFAVDAQTIVMPLDDFLVEYLQERKNITDAPLTIEFRDESHLKSTDAEQLASLYVPKLRRSTKLNKGEMRRWSMQSV